MQDPGKLDKSIEEWLPHAEKGTPGDLALEAKIAEWNARQDIVSHYPDTGVIVPAWDGTTHERSEEHTSELQSLMRISHALLCLKKKMESEGHTAEDRILMTLRTSAEEPNKQTLRPQ